MNKLAKYSAITLAVGAIGLGVANASGWYEDCPRYQGGPRHGQVERGQHPGRFGMGKHQGREFRNLDLNADEVRTLIEARLIMHGNDNLKVGDVSRKDDTTYLVQIVTRDGSLVREFDVNKDTGPRRMGPRPF